MGRLVRRLEVPVQGQVEWCNDSIERSSHNQNLSCDIISLNSLRQIVLYNSNTQHAMPDGTPHTHYLKESRVQCSLAVARAIDWLCQQYFATIAAKTMNRAGDIK